MTTIWSLVCHAEALEASRFFVFPTYEKVSLARGIEGVRAKTLSLQITRSGNENQREVITAACDDE
jgi:hypothetical protein